MRLPHAQSSCTASLFDSANLRGYLTPVVAPVDSGSKFTVMVCNSAGSVTSNAASLTVGPRSPKAGDLRFQQVGAASTVNGYPGGGVHSDVSGGIGQSFGNSPGLPLTIGADCGPSTNPNPYSCAWLFSSFPLPSGVSGLSISFRRLGNRDTPMVGYLTNSDGSNIFWIGEK